MQRKDFRRLDVALIALALVLHCTAQSPVVAQGQRTPQRRSEANARRAQQRRAQALIVVREAIAEASSLDDSLYRARLLALAGDVLWNADQPEARTVFRRAWQAATEADRAAQEELTSESTAGTTMPSVIVTETRDEILIRIARRDTALTEEFLQSLIAEQSASNNQPEYESQPGGNVWRTPSPRGRRSLALAAQMLAEGNDRRVTEIIRHLVLNEGVSGDLIAFLLRFRERNAVAADSLFHALVARMKGAGIELVTGNDVLLLSSYVFSPQLLMVVGTDGALQFRSITRASLHNTLSVEIPMPVAQAARVMFYNLAADALRRPLSPADESGTMARYFAIERLLPFFEREAAPVAAVLGAQRDALMSGIDATRRNALAAQSNINSFASDRATDPLATQVARLAEARGALERDRLRVSIIRAAVRRKLWLRARDISDQIEDASLRRAAASFIAAYQIAAISSAYAETDVEDYERAAQFVRGSEVAPAFRAWGFAQAALLAVRRNNRGRALELAVEAHLSARRAEMGTHEHIAALVVVAVAMHVINRERAQELLRETVSAINTLDDFSGDEIEFDTGGEVSEAFADEEFVIRAEAFRFDQVFALAARDRLTQAITEARLIEDTRPRLFAKLAAARVGLESQN